MSSLSSATRCLLSLPLLLLACGPGLHQKEKTAQPANGAKAGSQETDNLLDLARGVVILDRTGEASLEGSAVQAVDGDVGTGWATPPNDLGQSLIAELGRDTEITAVGFTNDEAGSPAQRLSSVLFEASTDGSTFVPLARVSSPTATSVLVPTKPMLARFVRASIDEDRSRIGIVNVGSLLLRGNERPASTSRPVTGSWKMNQLTASLSAKGSHLQGIVNTSPSMLLEGGTNGRLYRFVWVRGLQFGYGALTFSSDGRKSSGLWWFEECNPYLMGESWFGDRLPALSQGESDALDPMLLLERSGRFPLFGVRIRDDDSVDAVESSEAVRRLAGFLINHPGRRFRLVAREFRQRSSKDNRARSERQIASFRALLEQQNVQAESLEFRAAGDERIGPHVTTELQRAVASSIELADPEWRGTPHSSTKSDSQAARP